jgi:2-dehydropantoate 2-reductase
MTIQSSAILGAGAVGASLAHQILTHDPAAPVTLLAEGERSRRYRNEGLIVNGQPLRPPVAEAGDFDLVLVATKSYHLALALPLLDRCVGEATTLVSLLNGIASEEILGERYGHDRVVPAMIIGIDALNEPEGIRYLNRGEIHFGENPRVADQGPRVDALETWFRNAGLGYERSSNITRTLWRKFMINVGANQVSAVYRADYQRLRTDPVCRDRMRGAMIEVVALSEALGTGLAESDVDAWFDLLDTLDPSGKTSMLQDVEAERQTEVDLFAATVVELGRRHGIAVPINEGLLGELGPAMR